MHDGDGFGCRELQFTPRSVESFFSEEPERVSKVLIVVNSQTHRLGRHPNRGGYLLCRFTGSEQGEAVDLRR